MGYTSNIPRVVKSMRAEPKRARTFLAERLKGMIYWFDREVHEKTPVWSGRAVRNMIWSQNTPTTQEIEPIHFHRDYGEHNRDANQALAQATLSELNFEHLGIFYLSNNARDIGLIEDGAAPTPERSRTPKGVFRVTIAEMVALLHSGILK